MNIILKKENEVTLIENAGKIIANLHEKILPKFLKAGIKLIEIDNLIKEFILKNNGKPSFLNYNGFPNSSCISVNSILIHGIPNMYQLKDGDIVSIDIGVYKNGYHADGAKTYAIGKISQEAERLLIASKNALAKGIAVAIPGNKLSDIANAIYKEITSAGFFTPKEYVGHGIGTKLHEDPFVFNEPSSIKQDIILAPGMVLAIEPMLISGTDKTFVNPLNNWDVFSKDYSLTAHDEHTVWITKTGNKVLTTLGKDM